MIGETHRPDRTVVVPPWPIYDDDPAAEVYSPLNYDSAGNQYNNNSNLFYLQEELAALQRYLPSNEPDVRLDSEIPVNASSCDHFRMFEFKVRRCGRGKSHDWVECPYAHPGEKARRRDPRKFHYSCNPCPDFRNGNCKKGDSCEFAHGVFECWLHPDRYRTQLCKDGLGCKRRVCFFAHTPDQLRVVESADSYGGSRVKTLPLIWSSPGTGSPPVSPRVEFSPPVSPMSRSLSRSLGSAYMNEMVASLRNLKLGRQPLSSSWNSTQAGCYSPPPPPGFGSPRAAVIRPGFFSLPNTPTRGMTRPGIGYPDIWDKACEEEAVAERVESGRNIRAMMLEKLSKENFLVRERD
ncbi:tandem zinc finger 3, Arabidopsis thaliana oxidation-related zinc finger 2 [Hibiscus trionum]|uniref:Tandem zinc finger 3, Arabidopsis thaliana oxidation-related zinc finger 2 n=1 Tax=Hibiscus trionum TaxID=183268 RepID=A0A9W7J3B6_HIBTR|nr:tandem zinc finger 3, Arabidopsis thaliana oxidation-related zinc finger 2 [Hibiscus trionum]